MEQTNVTCDHCDKSFVKGKRDYLVVRNEPNLAMIEYKLTLIGNSHPLSGYPHHFCGAKCLKDWLVKNYPEEDGEQS
jgi:hypothetical protein